MTSLIGRNKSFRVVAWNYPENYPYFSMQQKGWRTKPVSGNCESRTNQVLRHS